MESFLTDIEQNASEALISSARNEEEVVEYIRQRVASLLDQQPDLLFSWMYRLDVYESKIKSVLAMSNSSDIALGLAQLIWDRQKQRHATKLKYRKRSDSQGRE